MWYQKINQTIVVEKRKRNLPTIPLVNVGNTSFTDWLILLNIFLQVLGVYLIYQNKSSILCSRILLHSVNFRKQKSQLLFNQQNEFV